MNHSLNTSDSAFQLETRIVLLRTKCTSGGSNLRVLPRRTKMGTDFVPPRLAFEVAIMIAVATEEMYGSDRMS
jgi:hypothetical protein